MKKFITLALTLLCLLGLNITLASNEVVEITLTEDNVVINNTSIDNSTELYPFIVYKEITYFPMTWDFAKAMGLSTSWTQTDGLMIEKVNKGEAVKLSPSANNDLSKEYKAYISTSKIRINGEEIDNKNEVYPLLTYKDITYFPMTWQFMVESFGSTYSWNANTGLEITTDTSIVSTNSSEASHSNEVKSLYFNEFETAFKTYFLYGSKNILTSNNIDGLEIFYNQLDPISLNDLLNNDKLDPTLIINDTENRIDTTGIDVDKNAPYLNEDLEPGAYTIFINEKLILYITGDDTQQMLEKLLIDDNSVDYYEINYNTVKEDVVLTVELQELSSESISKIVNDNFRDTPFYTVATQEAAMSILRHAGYYYGTYVEGWLNNCDDYETANAVIIDNGTETHLYEKEELKQKLKALIPDFYEFKNKGCYLIQNGDQTILYLKTGVDDYNLYLEAVYATSRTDIPILGYSTDGNEILGLVDELDEIDNDDTSDLDQLIQNNPTLEMTDNMKAVYFEADPSKGFNFPYVIFTPSNENEKENENYKKYLLLEGHNFGLASNDMDKHILNALTKGQNSHVASDVQEALTLPRIMPIIPKFMFENTANRPEYSHNHALDSTVMFIEDNIDTISSLDSDGYLTYDDFVNLYDIEEQIYAMVLDAQKNLRDNGYIIEDQIFTAGFSGAGNFSSRYTSIYPEQVKAMYSGGMFIPFVPATTYEGENLIYQIGAYDHEYLFGRAFDLEAYNDVAKIMYLGGQDKHDALMGNDTFTSEQRDLAMKLYGYDVESRWYNAQKTFFDVGGEGQFVTNKYASHNAGESDINHVITFFKNNSNSDRPIYELETDDSELILVNNLSDINTLLIDEIQVSSIDSLEIIGLPLEDIKVNRSNSYVEETDFEAEFIGTLSEKDGDKWYKVETEYANLYFYDNALRLSYIKDDIDKMIEYVLDFHSNKWDDKKANLFFLDVAKELENDNNYLGSGFNHDSRAMTFSADMVDYQGDTIEDPRATVLHELVHWHHINNNFDNNGAWFEESMAYYLAYHYDYKQINADAYPKETKRIIFDFTESNGSYDLYKMFNSHSIKGRLESSSDAAIINDLITLENLNHNSFKLSVVSNGRILEVSSIEYLVNVYGLDKLLDMLEEMRYNSYDFRELIEITYGKSIKELTAEWRFYTGLNKYFKAP